MSELDTLAKQFESLLKGTKTKHTLAEWRYAYREVIYSMGVKILERFPDIVIGQAPISQNAPKEIRANSPGGAGGTVVVDGQQPPFRPSSVGTLVCLVMGDCPHQN